MRLALKRKAVERMSQLKIWNWLAIFSGLVAISCAFNFYLLFRSDRTQCETPQEALKLVLLAADKGDTRAIVDLSADSASFEFLESASKDPPTGRQLLNAAEDLDTTEEPYLRFFGKNVCCFDFSPGRSDAPCLVFVKGAEESWRLREWSKDRLINVDGLFSEKPIWLATLSGLQDFHIGNNASPQASLLSLLLIARTGALEDACELMTENAPYLDGRFQDAVALQRSAIELLTSEYVESDAWGENEHCFNFTCNGTDTPSLVFVRRKDKWLLDAWDEMGIMRAEEELLLDSIPPDLSELSIPEVPIEIDLKVAH